MPDIRPTPDADGITRIGTDEEFRPWELLGGPVPWEEEPHVFPDGPISREEQLAALRATAYPSSGQITAAPAGSREAEAAGVPSDGAVPADMGALGSEAIDEAPEPPAPEIVYDGPPAAIVPLRHAFSFDGRFVREMRFRHWTAGDLMEVATSDPLATLILLERLTGESRPVLLALSTRDFAAGTRKVLQLAPRDVRVRLEAGS